MAAGGDSVLITRTRKIEGALRDDTPSHATVPGALVFGRTETGLFSFTFTEAPGNYELDAGTGTWEVGTLEGALALHGMVRRDGFSDGSMNNVTGFNLDMPRATSLIYGAVRTPAGTVVKFIDVRADTDSDPELQASAVTDDNGNFTLGVTAEAWHVDSEAPGHLFSGEGVNVTSSDSAVPHNITARPITTHLRGRVLNNLGNPVGNVEIQAYDFQNTSSWTVTDSNGNFDLGVSGGPPGGTAMTWSLQLNQGGDGDTQFIGPNVDFQVFDGNDHDNIVYTVLQVTAHLRGTLLLDGVPTGGYQVYASAQNFSGSSGSDTDSGGNFDIPVLGGTWRIGLSGQPGGIIPQNDLERTVVDDADQNGLNFHLRTANRSIQGRVLDTQGGIPNDIGVTATITVGGISFTSSGRTTPGGFYDLPAFPGTWSVGLNSADLFNQGYQPAGNQDANTTSGNATVNFTVTTGGGGSPFSNWQASFFTPAELADQNISGPHADPDRDGIVNLLEFAFDLRPRVSEPGSLPTVGYLPPVGPAAAFLTLTFTRLTGNPGIAYNVQEATDTAGQWTNLAASYEVIPPDNGTTETVRAKTPIGPGRKFLRLQVVLTGP